MPREIELQMSSLLETVCGPRLETPAWLLRPGKAECKDRWDLVREIYRYLESSELPDEMPAKETRRVDGVFEFEGVPFLFELDEDQHFNIYRATTLRCYPDDLRLAFSKEDWLARCARKARLEGGGFAKPRPPLFPGENGRHRQRAFRDALADILPDQYGFHPTLRLGDRECGQWIGASDPLEEVGALLEERLLSPH